MLVVVAVWDITKLQVAPTVPVKVGREVQELEVTVQTVWAGVAMQQTRYKAQGLGVGRT
jgi:hypothetical protein